MSGWDQQWLLRQAIVVLAVAALTLIAQIYQRKDGATFYASRVLRANLIYRWVGPIALVVGLLVGLAMTGSRVNGRLAGATMALAFAGGGLYLIYYCSVRRVAWSPAAVGLWTPLKKWRAIDFMDVIALDYSVWRQELLIIGPDVVIRCGDSFDGFEQLLDDLRRARPDLFGDDGGEPEPEEIEAAPQMALAPVSIASA